MTPWALADRDHEWDGDAAAEKRVRKYYAKMSDEAPWERD